MNKPKLSYGRSDLMVLSAVRYCLGRSSYIVSDCVDWLVEQWPNINEGMQKTILRDIKEAVEDNHAGMDMDKRMWERVVNILGGKNDY